MNSKDKRISFLSILSSITQHEQDISKAEDLTYAINKRLYEAYPLEETQTYQLKSFSDLPTGKGKLCPVCQSPMIRQTQKRNAKAPDWKCSDKNCKFQKAYDGGWRKSEFITGVWDEPNTDGAKAEDAMQDEANHSAPPPEYGRREISNC